ncbi:MAG: hypothetical protein GXP55_01980 [Deltaproteobacteria bacterium]|nr:hypothetical protein [Deltaproteobacteria bacterium]
MEHQSATFFERCHATDADPRATLDQRQACWTGWLAHYAEDQPPERVRYAETRCDALARGESLPPLPGLGPAVDETYAASYLALSVETHGQETQAGPSAGDAGASAQSADAGAATAPHEDRTMAPPTGGTTACSSFCVPRWGACVRRCDQEGRGCIGACEADYRTCLGGCY